MRDAGMKRGFPDHREWPDPTGFIATNSIAWCGRVARRQRDRGVPIRFRACSEDCDVETIMSDENNKLNQLFAKCWKDEALKARFMSDPKSVLKEHGMPVPDEFDVKVVENSDSCVHITIPAAPTAQLDLTDDELVHAAGGISGDGDFFTDHSCCIC